jgi:hypothetical protein
MFALGITYGENGMSTLEESAIFYRVHCRDRIQDRLSEVNQFVKENNLTIKLYD